MPAYPSHLQKSTAEFRTWFYSDSTTNVLSFANPETLAFAIIDKTRPPFAEDTEGELAGTVSFIHTSTTHLCTEIGFIVILPPYQRSDVVTNAVGLALQLAFACPEDGGLGMRRVDWLASTMNLASAALAERMGFQRIGITPWHMRFVQGKINGKVGNGRTPPPESDPEDLWRDCESQSGMGSVGKWCER